MKKNLNNEELLVSEEVLEETEEVKETPEQEVEEPTEEVKETPEQEVEEQTEDNNVYEEEAEETKEVVAKDYTKLSRLCYKLLTLLALVTAVVSLGSLLLGTVVSEELVFSAEGMFVYIVNGFMLLLDGMDSGVYAGADTIMPTILVSLFALFYVIYIIILVINLIILVFQFLGTIFARKEMQLKYSKFSRRSLTFACLNMAFAAACLMFPSARLTTIGALSLGLSAAVYVLTNLVVLLFNLLESEKKNWCEFGFDLGRTLAVLGVVVLFFVAFGKFNIMDIKTYIWYVSNDIDTVVYGTLMSFVVLELWLVTKACKLGRIALKHYAFDNGKKPVNKLIKKKSITLIILSILILSAKLFVSGVLATGDYVNSVMMYKDTYLVFILGAITLLFCLKPVKKVQEEAAH